MELTDNNMQKEYGTGRLQETKEDEFSEKPETVLESRWAKYNRIINIVLKVIYHLRKFVLAAPVVYYALKIAKYNSQHLPELVGLNLQTDGTFAMQITRQMAVSGPLVITGACLIMMFLSRKALYSWAISVFTLALPILLLVSNMYPF